MRLLKVDAAYMIESLRLRTESIVNLINAEVGRIAAEEAASAQVKVDQAKYVSNLESLVKELTQENAALAEAANTHPIPTPKKRARKAKVEAPWGYKKDGTPKQRPGRKV